MDMWQQINALAQLQHFVVATWQLTLLGIDDRALKRLVAEHGWQRWERGTYLLPGDITPRRRLMAALLGYSRPVDAGRRVEEHLQQHPDVARHQAIAHVALRCGAVVCGLSALWLHGVGKAPGKLWLRVPRHCGRASRRTVHLCHGDYNKDIRWIDGLPVVDVEQALIDVSGMTGDSPRQLHHRLTKLMATAHARRVVTLDRVEARLASAGPYKGKRALRAACQDLRGELSHSKIEAKARRLAAEVLEPLGLRLEPNPHPIELNGTIVAEADLAVVSLRLDLEIDGPHHLMPEQQEADQLRDRRARRAQWEVERFSTELVELRPKTFQAQVLDVARHRLERCA